jgi:hypothetical protein
MLDNNHGTREHYDDKGGSVGWHVGMAFVLCIDTAFGHKEFIFGRLYISTAVDGKRILTGHQFMFRVMAIAVGEWNKTLSHILYAACQVTCL